MKKKEARHLVAIAWKEINRFIKDWQRSPYEWNTERDVQVEIASRIKRDYKSLKKHKYPAKYPAELITKGYERGQWWNRVCCEPPVYYVDKDDGKRHCCKPDIVVFDNLKDPNSPPDIDAKGHKTKKNCPILWVCEIKYQPEWANKRPDKRSNWDLDKIRYLRNQDDGTKYACWLNISRERTSWGKSIRKKRFENGRVRVYNVTLPKGKP